MDIIPPEHRDEDEYRLRKVFLSMRELVIFLRHQRGVPDLVSIPEISLPEGWRVRGARLSDFGHAVEVLVYHPSFSPVPEGHEIPRFGGDGPALTWRAYHLATEDEVRSREARNDRSPRAGPVGEAELYGDLLPGRYKNSAGVPYTDQPEETTQVLSVHKFSGFKIPPMPEAEVQTVRPVGEPRLRKVIGHIKDMHWRGATPGKVYEVLGDAAVVDDPKPPKTFRERLGLPSPDEAGDQPVEVWSEVIAEQVEQKILGLTNVPRGPTKVQRKSGGPIMDLGRRQHDGTVLVYKDVAASESYPATQTAEVMDPLALNVVRLSESGVPLSVRPLDPAEVFG